MTTDVKTGKSTGSLVAMKLRPSPAQQEKLAHMGKTFLSNVVPPILVIAGLLALWEVLCSDPTSMLPPPSRVATYSRDRGPAGPLGGSLFRPHLHAATSVTGH